MNNEVSLATLWAKPDELREDIVTIVFCIKTPAIWKSLDQVKPQCIPCNCHHNFLVASEGKCRNQDTWRLAFPVEELGRFSARVKDCDGYWTTLMAHLVRSQSKFSQVTDFFRCFILQNARSGDSHDPHVMIMHEIDANKSSHILLNRVHNPR
jgi:hypothetical protein